MNKATSLQAKLLAVNTLNTRAEEIINHELEQLKNYIGLNIFKVDGSFKAKYAHEKLEFEPTKIEKFGFNWWERTFYSINVNYNDVSIKVHTSVSGGGSDSNGVSCYSVSLDYWADLFFIDKEGRLQIKERPLPTFKQYDEQEILAIQAKIKLAEAEYEKLYEQMPYQFAGVTNCKRLTY